MPLENIEPGSVQDWINHAESDLALAAFIDAEGVLPEALCFHAQQSVEKALKVLLIADHIQPPRTHNIGTLIDICEQKIGNIPKWLRDAAFLTDYAVTTRYPGDYETVNVQEVREAVNIAKRVLIWVKKSVLKD